ncbi:MAG: phosphoglycerate kinase [Deltaproteobacteria bacterium]
MHGNGMMKKILSVCIALQFIASSVPAYALRPVVTKGSGSTQRIAGDLLKDGGAAAVEIFAENTIVGDQVKDQDVGSSMTLKNLKKEGYTGSILGHSAHRKRAINKLGISPEKYDETMNHRIKAQLAAGLKKISLCVGSEKDNLSPEAEIAAIKAQLDRSFAGITAQQLKDNMFYLAFEPAGRIGTGKAEDTAVIASVHQAIYEWFEANPQYGKAVAKEVWGKSLKVLYGASVDDKNITGIMAVKSSREDMKGTQLVHGVLFASAGKKASVFVAVAKAISEAAERDDAQYVCFVNLKAFAEGKTPVAQYVKDIYQAVRAGVVKKDRVIMAIADQDQYLREWRDRVAEEEDYVPFGRFSKFISGADGGAAAIGTVRDTGGLIQVMARKGIKDVILGMDLNAPVADGKIEDDERIQKPVPTILKMEKESQGQFFYGFSHFTDDVKAGVFDKKFSLTLQAQHLQELLTRNGSDIEVVLLPYTKGDETNKIDDLSGAAKVIADRKASAGNKKILFLFENVRLYFGEQSEDPAARAALQQKFLGAIGAPIEKIAYINEAFDKSHRGEEASMEIVKLFAPENRAAGLALQEDIRNLQVFEAKRSPKGKFSVMTGGSKFKKYKDFGSVAKLVAKSGGIMFMLGAQANPFMKDQGKNIGKSKMPKPEKKKDISAVEKGLVKIKESKATVYTPEDFVLKGPQGIMPGYYAEIPDDAMQVDIGEKTIATVVAHIDSLVAGDAFVLNGGAGMFENPETYMGTEAVVLAAHRAAERGAAVFAAGGDMSLALKMVAENVKTKQAQGEYKGVVLSDKILRSTGGGVIWASMAKGVTSQLPMAALIEAAADGGAAVAQQLNVPVDDLQKFFTNDSALYNAMGGSMLNRFIEGLSGMLKGARAAQRGPVLSGDLSRAQVTAKVTYDSRKRSTVRAVIRLGDLEAYGEVPAGASKGEDEAVVVATAQAMLNIDKSANIYDLIKDIEVTDADIAANKGLSVKEIRMKKAGLVVPQEDLLTFIRKSGLDIGRHEDLVQLCRMIKERAGDNYVLTGANATVPVSWALWEMAAKLHGMQLWEYIRTCEPEAVANDETYYYMNIFNGGLHALKKENNEKLGRDRINIQEIMVAIKASSFAKQLERGDKIDQALKAILQKKYGTAEGVITRADESGFSVKGLGDSNIAIEDVLEAIRQTDDPNDDTEVKLCLDVAATSFYDAAAGYDFRGQLLTTDQMIQYYVQLADKYGKFIVSIEDGLAENDWEGWVKLTKEMEARGIMTIGDDLFVTQMGRLEKGIAMHAASAILIKVNQNGDLLGTLEVMKRAKAAGMKCVVSHRSGETIYAGIADLAYATRAFGLKTGDPQPTVDFQKAEERVRRSKYDRMAEIEKQDLTRQRAVIVSDSFFALPGAAAAFKALTGVQNVTVIAYGQKATKMKALAGSDAIVTARTVEEAAAKAREEGIAPDATVVLTAQAGRSAGLKQIVAGQEQSAAFALAKATTEAYGMKMAQSRFAQDARKAADEGIIAAGAVEGVIAKLGEGTSEFSVSLSGKVTADTESLRREAKEFMDKV